MNIYFSSVKGNRFLKIKQNPKEWGYDNFQCILTIGILL